LLLKEDAAVRLGHAPELAEHASFKPKLDRTLRLRAIRRLQTQKQAEVTMAERRAAALDENPTKGSRAKSAKAAAAAAAKAARAAKPKDKAAKGPAPSAGRPSK
ncbi:MAG: hypothetical protein ACRDMZ_02920, partial [Solirubrobacteraceae bacterium]